MWNPNDFEAPPDFMEALYGKDDEDNEEQVDEFIEEQYLEDFSDEEVLIFFSKYYCAFYVLKIFFVE